MSSPLMGDEEVERWLSAVEPRPARGRIAVVYLCSEVEASGLDLDRVRIWVEDKGGWGFFHGVDEPYFELPADRASAWDPEAPTLAEHHRRSGLAD